MNATGHEEHEALAGQMRTLVMDLRATKGTPEVLRYLLSSDGFVTSHGVMWIRHDRDRDMLVGWLGNEHDFDMRHLIELAV